ncbi:MAG TPA: PadR family transcriptional regulator [Pseudonocardia sp.]|jgi:DNA-binding PadR family transcriptional regulator|nr:PadR family transcriptional regulator [Pseudonocardia sp.]
MALRFAILTALAERGSTGLELARRFDRAFGFFWSASHQQIYRELDQLRDKGFVSESPAPARPRRGQPKHFEITPTGTAALRTWLAEVDEPTPPREAIVVKLRAAAAVDDFEGVRAAITHHLEVHERTYAMYREIEARDFSNPKTGADRLRHLVLEAGIRKERAMVDWGREVLKTLDDLQCKRR